MNFDLIRYSIGDINIEPYLVSLCKMLYLLSHVEILLLTNNHSHD